VLQETRSLVWQLPLAGLGVLGLWWGLRGTLGEGAPDSADQ